MKFYFTYGSSGMAYEGGWTEVEAPSITIAWQAFTAFHPSVNGSKVFYATDMGNLNGITASYYDLYLVEANYRDEEIQAKIAEKKVNGEYIYERRVLRDHMSEQDAIDWVYGNMRPDST